MNTLPSVPSQGCASIVVGASPGLSPPWRSLERGLGIVVSRHELLDLCDQLLDAGEAAAPDRLLVDQSKPSLHLVRPGGVSGRVVHVESGPLRQPSLDLGVLVGAIVIDDQVRRQILGHLLVDPPQEAQELLVPVPGPAAPLRWLAVSHDDLIACVRA